MLGFCCKILAQATFKEKKTAKSRPNKLRLEYIITIKEKK